MRYVQVSQTILSQIEMPYHIDAVTKVILKKDASVRDIYIIYSNEFRKADWGSAVFQIETDGRLTLINENYDSAD